MLLTVFESASAQVKSASDLNIWADFGGGIFTRSAGTIGTSFSFSMVGHMNKHFLKGRAMVGREIGFDLWGQSPEEHFFSGGVQYGRGVFTEKVTFYISAGPGIVSGSKYDINSTADYGDHWVDYTVLSLPLDLELTLKPFRNFGIGVSAIADFNSQYTYSAYMLKVSFGNLAP